MTLVENPRINTETPAWVIDRLSILMLKIYHMQEQTLRTDVDEKHTAVCKNKLEILLEQKADLCFSLNALIQEIGKENSYENLQANENVQRSCDQSGVI